MLEIHKTSVQEEGPIERILLDTNAVLFHAERSHRLSEQAYAAIDNPLGGVFVSAVTSAELACLARKGRFSFNVPWSQWFRETVVDNGWHCLDITWEIIENAFSLPDPVHHDPADRIIIATARLHQLTLVTSHRLLQNCSLVRSLS